MGLISVFLSFCGCCQTTVPSDMHGARVACKGSTVSICRRSLAPLVAHFKRGGPQCGSVAAFDLHGLAIRVRLARARVGWRLLRRPVQDRVAARWVFIRSRRSGLGTGRTHHVVIGLLCANCVGLRLVSPPRRPSGSKLFVKPVRWLNMGDGSRRSGGRCDRRLSTPSRQHSGRSERQYEDVPHSDCPLAIPRPLDHGVILHFRLAWLGPVSR
jgi:hypothetical protein